MSEGVFDPLGPLEQESLLRAEVLFAAELLEGSAETMDGPARAHAVDQYIQWVTEDGDMPLQTKRIKLAPLRPDHIVDNIAEAYVSYPVTRRSFVGQDGRSQLIFMRIVTTAGESQRYLITPERFVIFSDNDELQVDPLLLELNDFSDQDPGTMFIVDPSGEVPAGSDETLNQLQLLGQIVRKYKLKAQPLDFYPKAS